MAIFKKLFNSNDREISKLKPLQEAVLSLRAEMERLSDADLAGKTPVFRERLANGESPDKLLPEAFAVMREAARRVIDHEAFPVQVLGGIVLHQGRIAEMQTGEGKTLVSTMPGYLNALAGRTVHIITVNDYLARRDRDWMGQVYRFLGIPVGLVVPQMDAASKRASYSCPVIYGTNTEFGFDYLRDHMAWSRQELVQSALDYAIIDEVDSILIDEARTPLIISGAGEGDTSAYLRYRDVARMLKREIHYTVDEKSRNVALTEEGDRRVEEILGIKPEEEGALEDLEDPYRSPVNRRSHITQALKAKEVYAKDVDYVVDGGQVLIVDEFTGRILPGRRFSDGLHEALEAKEGVEVRKPSDTLATITVQNFYRMYKKLAGMTGTAMTEEPEFQEIYGLDVVAIPTNKPLIRTAYSDSIWKTERAKYKAALQDIVETHQTGRPVLVGTRSVEKSEMLSGMLARMGIPHEVLNAKQHAREAEIVAQAGRKGAVTIATNMAGRGTDILLGGNPAFMARKALRQEGFDEDTVAIASEKVLPEEMRARIEAGDLDEQLSAIVSARRRYNELFASFKRETDREHEEVVKLGGLHIIGTERHEARRIDNQLRGRSGRQGDPGSSRFYLSLEDELMRLFGGETISAMMDRLGFSEDEPIEHALVTKSVESAQKRVEAHNFGIRKHVVEYDNVLNKQRETIYRDRTEVLFAEDLEPVVMRMKDTVIERQLDLSWPAHDGRDEADLEGLSIWIKNLVPESDPASLLAGASTREDAAARISGKLDEIYRQKKQTAGSDMNNILRLILLICINREWVNHLRAMEDLREGVGLQAYGQRDPLVEYTRLGFEIFQGHMQAIAENVIRHICRLDVRPRGSEAPRRIAGPAADRPPRVRGGSQDTPAPSRSVPVKGGRGSAAPSANAQTQRAPVKVGKKVGRNDPCPCGSGKKYKDCCGKLA
ncbi:MAG: preprotein translocase subunit SecA [Bacillota bacterium]